MLCRSAAAHIPGPSLRNSKGKTSVAYDILWQIDTKWYKLCVCMVPQIVVKKCRKHILRLPVRHNFTSSSKTCAGTCPEGSSWLAIGLPGLLTSLKKGLLLQLNATGSGPFSCCQTTSNINLRFLIASKKVFSLLQKIHPIRLLPLRQSWVHSTHRLLEKSVKHGNGQTFIFFLPTCAWQGFSWEVVTGWK